MGTNRHVIERFPERGVLHQIDLLVIAVTIEQQGYNNKFSISLTIKSNKKHIETLSSV